MCCLQRWQGLLQQHYTNYQCQNTLSTSCYKNNGTKNNYSNWEPLLMVRFLFLYITLILGEGERFKSQIFSLKNLKNSIWVIKFSIKFNGYFINFTIKSSSFQLNRYLHVWIVSTFHGSRDFFYICQNWMRLILNLSF